MTDTDQNKEDEVLKRMLRTPHQKHEPTTPLGQKRALDRKGRQDSKNPDDPR